MKAKHTCIHCSRQIILIDGSFYHAEYNGAKCPIMNELKRSDFEAITSAHGSWYKLPERYQGREAS